ncbi:MAG: saccharopine dehydrogenase family protein [Bacteroidota bacterium]
MKNILILGAGLSSASLVRYLTQNAAANDWKMTIVDQDKAAIESKINGSPHAEAKVFNALDPKERQPYIEEADLVISMLPARYHPDVAEDCIKYKKNLITPSYVSPRMKGLHQDAVDVGITIMNEIGVDPGIDHMSAMRVIDNIRDEGGEMHIFESFAGGLVAPESDDNPWNYKFTWNPRNVVLAGQGGAAQFIQEGRYKYIPYNKLFRRSEIIEMEEYGTFEGYANRNSLMYREPYGLDNIPTIYRGTLRRKGFSRAWDVFVQLGATDDTYELEGSENMSNRQFINSFLPYNENDSVELKLRHYMKIDLDDTLWDKLVWLGIFDDDKKVGLKNATPAQMLQKILEEKWELKPEDKDMIAMYHKFVYKKDGEFKEITSEMVSIGEDQTYTAMSNTVGLPLGICVKEVLNGNITIKGVHIPTAKEVYDPILNELEEYGIRFKEKEVHPPRLYTEEATWR